MARQPKNIVFCAQSIDGYIAGIDGDLDWLNTVPNPTGDDMGYAAFINEIDAIVMGRNTMDVVMNFDGEWPYSKHVYVLSNQLTEVPSCLLGKVTLMSGDVSDVISHIHEDGHQVLYIDGGKTVQMFLKADCIDELRITTLPIILGGGVLLFGNLKESQTFDLQSSKVFLNQLVQNIYSRKHPSPELAR